MNWFVLLLARVPKSHCERSTEPEVADPWTRRFKAIRNGGWTKLYWEAGELIMRTLQWGKPKSFNIQARKVWQPAPYIHCLWRASVSCSCARCIKMASPPAWFAGPQLSQVLWCNSPEQRRNMQEADTHIKKKHLTWSTMPLGRLHLGQGSATPLLEVQFTEMFKCVPCSTNLK